MQATFLAVSCVATVWQSWMCIRLLAHRSAASRGVIRTSACRVGAAILYVGVGINALFFHQFVLQIALATFTFTQLMWGLNGLADVLEIKGKGKS